MAKVKTLRAHRNGYGDTNLKSKGDIYDHPSPSYLKANGFIERVDPPAQEAKQKKKKPPANPSKS